jgi:hypothetical protein
LTSSTPLDNVIASLLLHIDYALLQTVDCPHEHISACFVYKWSYQRQLLVLSRYDASNLTITWHQDPPYCYLWRAVLKVFAERTVPGHGSKFTAKIVLRLRMNNSINLISFSFTRSSCQKLSWPSRPTCFFCLRKIHVPQDIHYRQWIHKYGKRKTGPCWL